jgi:hypothetical protein
VQYSRFGITDNRPHSAGGVYISFNQLQRAVRLLRHNIHLSMMLPGPKEPSLEQLNNCFVPIVGEIKILYGGGFFSHNIII